MFEAYVAATVLFQIINQLIYVLCCSFLSVKSGTKTQMILKNIIGDLKNCFFPPLSKLEERNKKKKHKYLWKVIKLTCFSLVS